MTIRFSAAAVLCASLFSASLTLSASAAEPAAEAAFQSAELNALSSAQLAEIRQAVRSGNVREVRNLIESGVSPNFRMDNGDTGFTYAMRADTPEVARVMLESGKLAVNEPNRFGETPLMLAVFKGNREIFDALIQAGADPKKGGNWTPLHYAATEGRTEFIELLLKAGASPNAQTSAGVTPLIMAARKPSREAVVMLLKAGAYRDYCTDTGQSPADFARRSGDEELSKYLAVEKCAVKGPVRSVSGGGRP